ncbi:hypothetical protein VM1G_07244 [Cytospora mali]|uniref:3'-5' exonuclease domain-containing protein n=1 Tax=Cytospora mali TaxID=578113 RepID=A0A194W4A2_CYTMA|nr:hypothetical protein VM1G_07244 [Valsa mali]
MDARKHPSNWRLWHPNQGLVFQQPLYPTLDVARFFTEASVVKEIGTRTNGAEEDMAHNVSKDSKNWHIKKDWRPRRIPRKKSKDRVLEETSTETASLITKYTTKTEKPTPNGADTGAQKEAAGDGATAAERKTEAAAGEEAPTGPPFTPLDYKMTEDAFHAAITADEGTPESYWSYTLYRGPDGDEEGEKTETKVKVHYCRSALTAERVCQYFLNEKVIGFDLEWAPDGYRYTSPRRNVSLVQIASQSRIALIHLAMFPTNDELATPTFRKIMENPDITKVGVWIKGDCNRLEKYLGIKSRGIFELSHLYRQVKYSANGRLDLINKKLVSLADQVKEVLRLPLFKGQGVRSSNWSQALSMDQIVYSASDAYAGVHLFATLNHERKKLDPTPPLPYHAELGLPIPLALDVEGSSSSEADAAEMEAEVEAEVEAETDTDAAQRESPSVESLAAMEQRLKELAARANAMGATIQLEEDDGEITNSMPTAKPRTPKKAAAKASKPTPPPKDPRVIAAEEWLMEYKSTQPDGKTTANAAALKAYFIWHANKDLDPGSIGALLREPPLQNSTVMAYILQSVKVEKLPFDIVRLKKEVLDEFPKDLARKAYKGLVKMVEKTTVSAEESPVMMIYEKEEE